MWLSLAWPLIKGVALKYWQPIVFVLIIGGFGAYSHHRGAASRQPEVDAAKAQANRIRGDYEAASAKWNAERSEWDTRVGRLNADLAALKSRAEDERRAADSDAAARLADATKRLRDSQAALRIAGHALSVASAAPAECSRYEADPRLLPERDQLLLIRLGDRCDRVVLRLNEQRELYDGLVRRFLMEGQH